jgi:hypothetical protein
MIEVLVLLTAAFIENVGQQAAAGPQTMPRQDSLAETVRRALLEDVSGVKSLDALVQMGPAVAEEVKPYLALSNPLARSRAMYTLSRMPGIGPEVVAASLRSHDYYQRDCAATHAGPLLADPRVSQAFVDCVMNEPHGSQLVERAIEFSLLTAKLPARRQVSAELIPRVIEALRVPPALGIDPGAEARWAAQMILLLAQVADPGDSRVLDALARFRAEAESRFVGPADRQRSYFQEEMRRRGDPHAEVLARFIPLESVAQMRNRYDSVFNTIIFGQANLGDTNALAEYATDVLSGSPETKLVRLKLLPRFNPSAHIMDLAVRLLEDTTQIERDSPVGAPIPEFRRTCDLAIDALGGWCPELKEMTRGKRIYRDNEIQRARQIGHEYLVRLQASSGISPGEKTITQVLILTSRPVTQPATRRASRAATQAVEGDATLITGPR